jgi:H+-transporting ATPase
MLTGELLPIEARAGDAAYAGALIRRGEAVGEVIATGIHTRFGRTAEFVRSVNVESSEQKAILRIVRNLALFNGAVTILLTIYALWLCMPRADIISLIRVAVLSSMPVALPSMFSLAAAIGAEAFARQAVLPTSLSAVDEAGGIDILCPDKTRTLTRNELAVMCVHPMEGFYDQHVLALAALASTDGDQDPVDAAIRVAALRHSVTDEPKLVHFLPFDPR